MKTKSIQLILGSVLALSAGFASANDDKALSPTVVEQLNIVNKLIALGDARQDPLLLLAAASMQKSMGVDGATAPAKSTAAQTHPPPTKLSKPKPSAVIRLAMSNSRRREPRRSDNSTMGRTNARLMVWKADSAPSAWNGGQPIVRK